jgi:virulence-associated protein VapD
MNLKKLQRMTRIAIIRAAFSLLLLGSTAAMAQVNMPVKEVKKYAFEKRKTFEKSYAISSTDKVNIAGQFGSVTINTWEKNETKLTAEIIVTAKTESWAEAVVNNVKLADLKSSGNVSFSVENDDKIYRNKNSQQTIEVNMVLYLPANNPLKVQNKFGPITIPDYTGKVDIESEFGALTAGNLANAGLISVSFGKAKIKSMANVDAAFKFSQAEVDNVTGSSKISVEFCSPCKITIASDASKIDISEGYSILNIRPAAGLQASYVINTRYSSFKNRTDTKLLRTNESPEYGPDRDREYEGKSGNGNCAIKIKSSFGKIILGEATAAELESKKDKKGKMLGEDED